MKAKPDPKLKAAIEEIKPILQKYDVAALVVLSSEDALEYLFEIEPSWSCMHIEKRPDGLFLRVQTTHLPETEKKRQLQSTIGFVVGFLDVLKHLQEQMGAIAGKISETVEFKHWTKFLGGERKVK